MNGTLPYPKSDLKLSFSFSHPHLHDFPFPIRLGLCIELCYNGNISLLINHRILLLETLSPFEPSARVLLHSTHPRPHLLFDSASSSTSTQFLLLPSFRYGRR